MKLWAKNLKGDKFEIEVEPTCKTKDVKESIFKAQGYEVALQKLIVQGKIMQDEVQISEYNIKEGDFVVVMVQKPKPQQQAKASEQKPTQTSTQQVQQQQQQSPRQLQPPVVQEQQQAPASNFYDQSISSLVTGQELEKITMSIVEMGFPREEVIAALKAAYNNPDRAIEYLMTGIPQNTQHSHRAQQNQQRQQSSRSHRHHQAQESPQQQASQRSTFSSIVNDPSFHQIRLMLQQNPQLIGQVLQQIRSTNPQLFQLINENQQEFLQLLQQPPQTQNNPQQTAQNQVRQSQPHSQGQIKVILKEKEAMERIVSMGFNKKQVLQAYFACEKNEEATVNFLLQEQAEDQKQLAQREQQLLQQPQPQQSQQNEIQKTEQQQVQVNQSEQQQAEQQQAGQQQTEKQENEQQQVDQQQTFPEQEKQESEQQQQEPKESAKNDNEQPPSS